MTQDESHSWTEGIVEFAARTMIGDDILAGIGRVVVEFESVHNGVTQCVTALIGRDDIRVGRIVSAELSFRGLVDLMMALFRNLEPTPKGLARTDSIRKRLIAAGDTRNKIIHAQWLPDLDDPPLADAAKRVRETAKAKGYRTETAKFTAAELHAFADELGLLWLDLMDLAIQCGFAHLGPDAVKDLFEDRLWLFTSGESADDEAAPHGQSRP